MRTSRATASIACLALASAGLVAAATPAQASTLYVWSGGGDGNSWSDPDNWTPTGVPDASSESARILEGQVYVGSPYDIDAITLGGTGAIIDDGSGSLTATSFDMLGGTLSVPVTAASFAFTGPDDKEVTSSGSINATLVRGGNQGEVHVQGGKVELNTDGTTESGGKSIKAKTSLTISARIDGRGANRATIEIEDSGCNPATSTFVCGVLVERSTYDYGAAFEGVTLVSSNITLLNSAMLALREGYWKPRSGGTVRSVNGAMAILETGSPYPPGEPGTPAEEVSLPPSLTLDSVIWRHYDGMIAGNGDLLPGAASSRFEWSGGVLTGRVAAKLRANRGVSVSLHARSDAPLELDGPARGNASLTLEAGGEITKGTRLVLDEVSSLINKTNLTIGFQQRPGSTITSSGNPTSASKVLNQGLWEVVPDPPQVSTGPSDPATIEEVPFVSSTRLVLHARATLSLTDTGASNIGGKTTVGVDSATSFGRLLVGLGTSLKLAGGLDAETSPTAGLTAGDEMLVVESEAEEGDPSGITGGFSPVTGSGLPAGLGYSGELINEGYVLAVGGAEELALTGTALGRIKSKRPLQVTYTVLSKASTVVAPQLNLPLLTGAKIAPPTGADCAESGKTLVCTLDELPPGERWELVVSYTFSKPGKQVITTTVTSAGYNPNPAGATSTLTVKVTR